MVITYSMWPVFIRMSAVPLNDNYTMAKSEWVWDNGECYCFNSNGTMYANCITPDGYKVDKTGVWVQ
ncbi:hypothetical protein [Clostridium sp. YIM B02555]|uniref:hypothetical protein n=1 Tax=Clostridium sp. YIM B02555 TaxID=2911968 RepID=UPI001EED43FC|nr:hypothetical protein [Clostridium sp. YIM B02555]